MGSRIRRAVSRAQYAAIGGLLGGLVGGLISKNAASSAAALGALAGATVGELKAGNRPELGDVTDRGRDRLPKFGRGEAEAEGE